MSLRRDESADHVIRTSIGWYEAGALSLTANSKKICPPQWYRLAAAVLLQHAVMLFILLPNAPTRIYYGELLVEQPLLAHVSFRAQNS